MVSRNVKATTIETKGAKVDPSECMGVANLNFRIDSRNGPQGRSRRAFSAFIRYG